MPEISIKDYLSNIYTKEQSIQETTSNLTQESKRSYAMQNIVDFLTEHIFEEAEDAAAYKEQANNYSNSTIKNLFIKIAENELEHQKILINILADLAKEGNK